MNAPMDGATSTSKPAEGDGRRASAIPFREWAAVVLVAAVAVGALFARTELKTEGTALYADPGWDRHLYIEMARAGAFDFHLAPYCWRVLIPAIAGWMPFGLQANFLILTALGTFAAAVTLYCLFRLRGSAMQAMAGMLLFFSLGWAAKFVISDFWLPDPAAFFLAALAFYFAATKQPVAFGVVLAVGAATKENVLFVAPLFYTLNTTGLRDRKTALTSAAALSGAAVVLIALRVFIDQRGGDEAYIATLPGVISRFPEIFPSYSYPDLFETVAKDQRWRYFGWEMLRRYTTGSFGTALFVLLIGAAVREWRLALRLSPFLLLVYAQLLFATDTERLLVFAFPAVGMLVLAAHRGLANGDRRAELALPGMSAGLAVLPLVSRTSFDVPLWPQLLLLATYLAALLPTSGRELWRRRQREGA